MLKALLEREDARARIAADRAGVDADRRVAGINLLQGGAPA